MSALNSHLRELRPTLALALPIVVGQVSQMLMGVLDSIMIGHAGTVPLAASAFGSNVFSVFYVLGIGFMFPVSIFVARSRGAQQPKEAAEYLRHGVALAIVVGIIETAVMAALSTQLERFGQPPEVLAIVKPFYLLFAFSLTPVLVYLALRQFAEALGHPWAPMMIMLGSIGLNAALNWVFIFGHLGAPALGLTGAGIATLISRVAGAWGIFIWLRRYPAVRAAWPSFGPRGGTTEGRPSFGGRGVGGHLVGSGGGWLAPFSGSRFREMLRVGLPAAGMLLFESTAFAFSGFMMGWLGAVPLAAHQIAITCASLAFMFPLGIAMAAGMRVSHAVGAGERGRLRPVAFSALSLGLAVMSGFALAFAFGGRVIAGWFVHDPAVIALAAQLLVVAGLFQLFDGMQVTGAAVLRAISDVRVPTLITFVAYWGIALPVGYFIGVSGPLGPIGVWIGIASGLAFAAVFLNVRFAHFTRPKVQQAFSRP